MTEPRCTHWKAEHYEDGTFYCQRVQCYVVCSGKEREKAKCKAWGTFTPQKKQEITCEKDY